MLNNKAIMQTDKVTKKYSITQNHCFSMIVTAIWFSDKENDAKLTLVQRERKAKVFVDDKWAKLWSWPTYLGQYKVH